MTIERISPQRAHDLIQDEEHVFVDVRSLPEFDQGHPTGSYNVPFMHKGPRGMSPNADFVAVMEVSFPKDTKLVLGCRSGGRSLRAAQALEAAGFTSVLDQRAGFLGQPDAFGQVAEPGWKHAGLPVAIEPESGRDYAALAAAAGK